MVASSHVTWHTDTLPESAQKALADFSAHEWLEGSGWYLAGGTALALQVGHRRSVDLDFFTQEKGFQTQSLLTHFPENDFTVTVEEPNTLYGELHGAKVSFIAYPFFTPKEPFLPYGHVQVLDKRDIAVMKIIAISQRGKKRDFVDLYWYANNEESLEDVIKRLPEQYPRVAHDYQHILKALVYFADAEQEPMPDIYFSTDWEQIKAYFTREVPDITKRLLHLM